MKLICEECQSQNNEFDERLGETVCKDCGLVLITEMFEETVHILDSTGELVHSPDKNKLGFYKSLERNAANEQEVFADVRGIQPKNIISLE